MITPKKSSDYSRKALIMTPSPSQMRYNQSSITDKSYKEKIEVEETEEESKHNFLFDYNANDYIESLRSYVDNDE